MRGTADPVTELRVPVGGRELAGDELRGQLAAWVDAGVVDRAARQVEVAFDGAAFATCEAHDLLHLLVPQVDVAHESEGGGVLARGDDAVRTVDEEPTRAQQAQ